jgi:Amt family ammonium transporter
MDQGNTAFVLFSAALVLLMTPGLAFFYGGLVKAKSVVSMIMLSFGSLALIAVLWVLYGYAITFADVGDTGWIGIPHIIGIDTSSLGLSAQVTESANPVGAFPELAFVSFQATFAIITVALISGAIADRAKFGAWMVFAGLWATLVYFPVAGWVFNFTPEDDGGWIVDKLGAIDFAGGTAVHINAGAAALALAIVLGKRFGFSKGITQPHNVPLTLIGASLLWFGWFGFNAGSQLAADGIASLVVINTIAAPAAAMLGWISIEKIRHGKGTSIGAASGAIAGLVGFDDSLDVVGIHLVGGVIGTLFIGLVGADVGLFFGFGFDQLIAQALGAAAVFGYSFVVALGIGYAIEKTMGFRVQADAELAGIDTSVHGEEAYSFGRDRQN